MSCAEATAADAPGPSAGPATATPAGPDGWKIAALRSRRRAKWLASAVVAPGHRSQHTAADFTPGTDPFEREFHFQSFDDA
jgi:hypothetical protein